MKTAAKLVSLAIGLAGLGACSESVSLREWPVWVSERLGQLARATVPGIAAPSRARSLLELGLQKYELGDYAASAKYLRSALVRGLDAQDRVVAHKYLAFIHCAAERKSECKAEFRDALRVDPALDLDAAEAGHPTWGPVFQSVKVEAEAATR